MCVPLRSAYSNMLSFDKQGSHFKGICYKFLSKYFTLFTLFIAFTLLLYDKLRLIYIFLLQSRHVLTSTLFQLQKYLS